jgi:hypothetical protein
MSDKTERPNKEHFRKIYEKFPKNPKEYRKRIGGVVDRLVSKLPPGYKPKIPDNIVD